MEKQITIIRHDGSEWGKLALSQMVQAADGKPFIIFEKEGK